MGDSNASSSSGYHPQKRYWTTNLDITVTIRYREPKATQYFSKFDKQSIAVLREDLLALKIPHPKADKMVLASHGVVEFSWSDIEPYKRMSTNHKILHNNLIQKLRPPDPHYKGILRKTLEESQIVKASFWESPTGEGSSGGPSKKRPYQNSAEDFEPFPPSKKFAPGPNPHGRDLAAEQFLNDTLKTLAVKSEPVDVPLPPVQLPSGPHASLSSQVGSLRLPGSTGASSGLDFASNPSGSAVTEPLLKDLMHDLWEVRKSISYAREKEETLLEQIQKLHPQFKIPNSDQKDLEALRTQLGEARNDANVQRKLKEDLQQSLDDIRKETKEPFVVPALIDAFLSISKLSAKIV